MNIIPRLNILPEDGIKASFQRIIGATAGSQVGVWMSRKITDLTGVHLGTVLDRIPMTLQYQLFKATSLAQMPIQWIGRQFIGRIPDPAIKVILAPILEEVVYRFGIQQGIDLVLLATGLNPTLAKTMAIGISSIMFGMAHNPDFQQDRFISTMIPGIFLGLVQAHGGLIDAISVHSMTNLIVEIRKKLGR